MEALIGMLIFAVVAVLGWKVFSVLRVPAAPVLGGMVFIIAASLIQVPLALPSRLRLVMSVSLGISIGSRFNMTISRCIVKAMIRFIVLVIVGSLTIGVVVGLMGMERQTAMFASLLGGLTEMTFLAQEFQIDSFQVTLFQTVRMCLLLVIMPVIARSMPQPVYTGLVEKTKFNQATETDWLLIILLSLACGWGLGKFHIPAGHMLGGAFFTASYSKFKNLRPKLNSTWHNTMLSFLGGATGLNVTVTSILHIPQNTIPLTVYLCLIALVVWIVYSMLRRVAGLDKRTALFSATMGGLGPSVAMAEVMGADSTVVSSFQVVRYFTVIILAFVLGYVV